MSDFEQPFEQLSRQIADGVARGVRQALTDPDVIEAMGGVMISVIQKQAAARTGNFLLSMIKAFFTRWLIVAVILIALAQVIGIPAALRTLVPALTAKN